MDWIYDWLRECCVQDPSARTLTSELFASYRAFDCADMTQNRFSRILQQNRFGLKRGRGRTGHFFEGVKLRRL